MNLASLITAALERTSPGEIGRQAPSTSHQASKLNDRSNFLAFAETWCKLANEIDYSDRLVAFIDGLGVKEPMLGNREAEEISWASDRLDG